MSYSSLQKRIDAARELEKHAGGNAAKRPKHASLEDPDGVLDLKRVRDLHL
jgi:hypothetical protein